MPNKLFANFVGYTFFSTRGKIATRHSINVAVTFIEIFQSTFAIFELIQ